jgi:hypothetical protein
MQWHFRQGRRDMSCPPTAGTLNEPIPPHCMQRPDPLHALQMFVFISLLPANLEKVSSGSLAAGFSRGCY